MLGVQQGKTRHNNSRNKAHTYPDFSTQFKAPQGSGKEGGGGPKADGSAGATQCINYHPTTNHNHRPEVLRAWSCCENNCIQKTKQNKKNKEDSVGEKKKKKKKKKRKEKQHEGKNKSRRWFVNESLEMSDRLT